MNHWLLALVFGIVTIMVVALAAASGLQPEGITVSVLALAFLLWASFWASGRGRPA